MYFTVAEATKLLGVTKSSVYRDTIKKRIGFRYFRKVLYIPHKEVERIINEREKGTFFKDYKLDFVKELVSITEKL